MDANKLAKLKEIGYHVPKTCGLCINSQFASHLVEWGECTKHSYDHQKHTDSRRQLSVYRGGTCSGFELSPLALSELHGFAELVR